MDENLLNEGNIIDTVIKMMEKAEQFVNKTGLEKKAIVLDNIKSIMGVESYNRYKYLISSTIDFIIEISKGKKLNLNNLKKKFCCISI